ncbi:MAG: PilZ domain-containing protein [Elusimicrobia bacterium]|nr:PilZ domain-containing protein [Elusimicrobiota bacterium]
MTDPKDRRQFRRFPVLKDIAKPVDLYFEPSAVATPVPAVLLDISAGGIGILTFVPIEVGTSITSEIKLPGIHVKRVEGTVLWTLTKGNSWRVGIAFTKIEKDDFTNIKQLADDYIDCETKLSMGVTDVCFKDCHYRQMCSKDVKLK